MNNYARDIFVPGGNKKPGQSRVEELIIC